MAEVSRFYGIIVYFHWNEHPPPHLHARYGGDEITVTLDSRMEVEGRFPRRALTLLLEWVELHRDELLEDWRRAERKEPLLPVEPL